MPKKDIRRFMDNCPILEQTGDGEKVGRCWHYVGGVKNFQICPRHGDVSEALERYDETGKLTLDSKHVRKFPKV